MSDKRASFIAYVNIFDDSETDTQPDCVVLRRKTDTSESEDLVDSGDWLIVSSSDPVMSLISYEPDSSLDVSAADNSIPSDRRNTRKSSLESGPDSPLCGYLQKYKIGSRGVAFKRRWFVHADSSCRLLYYRTPNDHTPLGEIDIAHASFSFNFDSDVCENIFEIRTPEKTFLLKANNRHTMLYWLQQLQLRRKQFHSSKNSHMFQQQFTEGLLKCQDDSNVAVSDHVNPANELSDGCGQLFLENISTPPNTVGMGAAKTGVRQNMLRDMSLTNLRTELSNMIANFKIANQTKEMPPRSDSSESRTSGAENTKTEKSLKKVPSFGMPGRIRNLIRQKRSSSEHTSDIDDFPKALADNCQPTGNQTCHQCKQLEEELNDSRNKLAIATEELAATTDLLKIVQKNVDKLQRQVETQEAFGSSDGTVESYLQALQDKDVYINELEHRVVSLRDDLKSVDVRCRFLEAELSSVKEDMGVYAENLHVKDDIVKSLTTRIGDLERAAALSGCQTANDSTTFTFAQELNQFRDRCHAYEVQNKFLNQEIMELHRLLREKQEGEKDLADAQAMYEQLKSKFLFCVYELNRPRYSGTDADSGEMINRLLQDAIQEESPKLDDADLNSSLGSARYDEYGFEMTLKERDGEGTDNLIEQRIENVAGTACRRRSDVSKAQRWETFFIGTKDQRFQPSKELKTLVRDGIPPEWRSRVWKKCIDMHVWRVREVCGPNYYKNLVARVQQNETGTPAKHQVRLDLTRTLPNNKHYESVDSKGIPPLENILLAFAIYSPEVGYCQGMNRLAAILLLFLDEEEAFWGLVAIIESLMPRQYYDRTLIAAHADQRVLKDIVAEKLPQVHSHFIAQQCDLSMFTFNWFLVLFVDNLPVATYLRIWDSFLYEGSKVMFRYAVAILKVCEAELLSKNSCADLNYFMRSIGDLLPDADKLSQVAFHDLNPFPMKLISIKRQFYLQKLRIELEELEKLRDSFERSFSHAENDRTDVLSSDDERD